MPVLACHEVVAHSLGIGAGAGDLADLEAADAEFGLVAHLPGFSISMRARSRSSIIGRRGELGSGAGAGWACGRSLSTGP
jgi:hypothetical protein